ASGLGGTRGESGERSDRRVPAYAGGERAREGGGGGERADGGAGWDGGAALGAGGELADRRHGTGAVCPRAAARDRGGDGVRQWRADPGAGGGSGLRGGARAGGDPRLQPGGELAVGGGRIHLWRCGLLRG